MESAFSCQPIRLSYFFRIPNVGDRINPAIVSAVSGHPTVHVAGGLLPHLLAVGSLMAVATSGSQVWGTGVMHPKFGDGAVTGRNIHAVRGKLSARALRHAGVNFADVPLGDPGFLGPALFGIARASTAIHTLGVVPHYVDRGNPLFRQLLAAPGVIDLNVHEDPMQFLREMAQCAAVISSSLHGLIFAEALGIPNLWVTASHEIAGGAFKFEDWFSTTKCPQRVAHILTSKDTVENLAARAKLHDSSIDTVALRDAFPYGHLDEIREAEPRTIIPVDHCRSRPTPAFVISFNRGAILKKTIAAIQRLARPVEAIAKFR
jgi:Polysaccharide pyruvyl transferase